MLLLHAEFSINVDTYIFFFSQSFLHLLGGTGTSVLIRTAIWHEFNGLHGSEYFTSWKWVFFSICRVFSICWVVLGHQFAFSQQSGTNLMIFMEVSFFLHGSESLSSWKWVFSSWKWVSFFMEVSLLFIEVSLYLHGIKYFSSWKCVFSASWK